MKNDRQLHFDLKSYLSERCREIDQRLEILLDCRALPSRLCEAMHYSLMGSGKRLRPVLCLASADAVGNGETDSVWRAACAIEMIHTYSLIHDDLPAMDNDELRRGNPTCHIRFDEATAILAGDGLLTLAFEILATGNTPVEDESRRLTAIASIARAAGYRGMIEGQMRDMDAEGRQIGLDDLKAMHGFKTGALIEAAVVCGALLGSGTHDQITALKAYAGYIGLAFQVTDDILNVEGDPELMGKAAGTDAARAKSTYPTLLGLAESKEYAAALIDKALQALSIFDNKAMPLKAIAEYIINRNR